MKNKIAATGICVALLAAGLFTTSCNLDESQVKVVAQNAGIAAAITWIAYDSPDTNATALVSLALDIISDNIGEVQSGKTYMEVMFPKIEDFTRSDAVPDQYEPLVLAGSLAALNGLDLLFATNPSWKEAEGIAFGIVNSFVMGAKLGLALDDSDPRIVQAREFSAKRARVFK